jgi:hypothetical protein
VRKLVVLASGMLLAGLGGIALAGEPATLGNDIGILQVSASPPRSGTAARPRPAAVDFSTVFYTSNGQRTARSSRTIAIRFAGFRFNPSSFAKCLESKLEQAGPSACPAASKIGTGTAVADARPTLPTPVRANVVAFNGTLDNDAAGNPAPPRPAILILADAGGGIKSYIPVLFRGKDTVVTAEGTPPAPGTQSLFSITALHLVLPAKTKRVGRRKVAFAETPRSCPGGRWRFVQTNTYYSGETLVATDTQPCVR